MPIEIKEILIRAFVGGERESKSIQEKPREKKAINLTTTVKIVTDMMKQKNER
ncbi:MAG: DUF5908 family protein [bacterium]|nr:DUF5908 family protein [bacterium]